MEVDTAVKEFLAAKRHLSPYTRRSYRQRLGVFADWCKAQGLTMDSIQARSVRAFLEDVSKRHGRQGTPIEASTLRVYATVIRTFLAWAAKEDDLDIVISPTIAQRLSPIPVETKVIETFTAEQLQALFAACEQSMFPVRDKAVLSVLIDTGARASEVVGLMLDSVWLEADDSYILVRGKGKKQREIALGRQARLALRRYITRHRKPKSSTEQHVFLSRSGKPLQPRGLSQLLSALGRTAGVQGTHPHRFRHHFACQYLLAGGDVYKLSRLMGHTSVKVTERYLSAVKAKQVRSNGYSVLDHLKDHL